MAIIHDGNSVPISSTNPLPTSLVGSDVQVPVDIQSRYATTIQTQTAVMVGPSGSNLSVWVDTNGFDKVAATMLHGVGTDKTYAHFRWSNDGITVHGMDDLVLPLMPSAQYKAAEVGTKARFLQVFIGNNDTVPHTISLWVYLKA